MKKRLIPFALLTGLILQAQEKFICKTGKVTFEASATSFEEIKATSSNAVCALSKSGDLASVIIIKTFQFKNNLMQEHFNENYLESEKYPKAVLKGKIANFSLDKLTEKAQTFTFTGTMEMHGVTKEVTIPLSISKNNTTINIDSEFSLKPDSFNIQIPSVVGYKIAKSVNVNTKFSLN